MFKVLITGPEASGKTTLSQFLARRFQVPWVPEFARTYLTALDRPYTEEDLLLILNGQLRLQNQHEGKHPLLFCDTGPEVIYIWSEVKFGQVDDYIQQQFRDVHYDLRLLCYPDLPWEYDPLREAPDAQDRLRLYDKYVALLEQAGFPYTLIKGDQAQREHLAHAAVKKHWGEGAL